MSSDEIRNWIVALAVDRRVPRGGAQLAALIADHLDEAGLCRLPRTSLAKELGLATVSVNVIVRELRRRGFLQVVAGSGRGHVSTLRPTLPGRGA